MSTVSPIVGCDVTGGATKTVSTTSQPGGCTGAPLIWNENEGDNTGLPRNVSAMTSGIPIPFLEMKPNATGGSCAWTPLIIEDDEGDNVWNDTLITIPFIPMKNDTDGASCALSPLMIEDDEGDNVQNDTFIIIPTIPMKNDTNGASCPWSPLTLDDDEGDDYVNSSISIPVLSMKPTTVSSPSAPHLLHPPITKPPKAPHLSQTAHPTPPPSTVDSPSPTAITGPEPIAAGGRWEIKIEQSQNPPTFHWTLFDTGGFLAGGGDSGTPIQCLGRLLQDCFPFEIQFIVDPKLLYSFVNFEVMLDLPSGSHMKFGNLGAKSDHPQDGYPKENFGCGDDSRNQLIKDVSRTFWCYFVWHGQGGWDGLPRYN